jgi:hypothetical protein
LGRDCNLVQLVVVNQNSVNVNSEYGVNLEQTDKYDLQSWVVLGETNKTPALCELLDDAGVL